VIYLGANVPAEQFEETVKSVNAKLVILVAQTLITAATLQLTAQALTDLRARVGYGGRIFSLQPNLANHIPGYYLGASLTSSLDTVEKLLHARVKPKPLETISKKYVVAHQAFVSSRAHIESAIKELVQPLSLSPEGLNTGIQFLGDNIAAALQLGDMKLVTEEMEWLKTLLQSHQRPSQELAYFMEAYSQAVDKHINGQGEPIKTWLNAQSTQG
jgi:hypothetical protein